MRRHWLWLVAIAGGIGLGLLAIGLFTILNPGILRAQPKAPKAIIQSTPFPMLTPAPTQFGDLRVKLPSLAIDLPVVEGDGWNAPLYQAAHYPGMKWPGEGGRSLLYAHARDGMFGPLFHASVGDTVEVSGGSHPVLRYVIRQYFPHWPNSDTRWLEPVDHEELILLTCTTYNPNDPRIIAVAEPA